MPSFAFWKSSKPDESKSPLLSDAAVTEELSVIIPGTSKAVDLNPGNQDSGIFLFDEDAQELPGDQTPTVVELKKNEENAPRTRSPAPESTSIEEPSATIEPSQEEEGTSTSRSRPLSLVPKESGSALSVEKRADPVALGKIETNLRDRDSGVYMSDNESSPAFSQPSSIASNDHVLARSRVSSLSKPTTASPQPTKSIARLQRPAELNLGFNSAPDPAKPRSELDLRYDLIRNSKTKSKAALRSPTQLLQDRLNMSPKKRDVEEKVHVFTPPRATVNGCLIPGPGAQAEAFTSTSVRAKTEAGGRPAWWCKFDKLVVFDGIEQQGDGEMRLRTRTSKGLSIARRLGDLETVVIPLDCAHCHEMLNRHEWKYDMRVCKRSVCWDCKERCKWEYEQEKMASTATPRTDANRERADSMLQDEQSRGHGMTKEIAV
ncbi:hypothetical protein BU25DRAFT_428346 [Macroventuria anomochaeta]|uniref:Uncharacterized protein n=1 Tax=Macroventuria anomochaeta TaxID=301207 RepID=A0ACB6SB65_9PLEO|nr:uncharacterized protein BU25DRAFT_428346 [Macroventuria anomochaeta]KAF2631376.1 hypothetical protein BU25DRAFT_428346 [Macroventuria anomochaeta]